MGKIGRRWGKNGRGGGEEAGKRREGDLAKRGIGESGKRGGAACPRGKRREALRKADQRAMHWRWMSGNRQGTGRIWGNVMRQVGGSYSGEGVRRRAERNSRGEMPMWVRKTRPK